MKKLKDSELKVLQEANNKQSNLYFELGKLQYQQTLIARELDKAIEETKEIIDDFQEKYGEVEVNINTGEMREIKKNE